MAAIRSHGNRDTELRLVSILHAHRITGWRRNQKLPGKPDFVFRKERLVVFVDGCFWHGCSEHSRTPKSNVAYWRLKIARNKARDRKVARRLKAGGWGVLRMWEHQLSSEIKVAQRIRKKLLSRSLAVHRP